MAYDNLYGTGLRQAPRAFNTRQYENPFRDASRELAEDARGNPYSVRNQTEWFNQQQPITQTKDFRSLMKYAPTKTDSYTRETDLRNAAVGEQPSVARRAQQALRNQYADEDKLYSNYVSNIGNSVNERRSNTERLFNETEANRLARGANILNQGLANAGYSYGTDASERHNIRNLAEKAHQFDASEQQIIRNLAEQAYQFDVTGNRRTAMSLLDKADNPEALSQYLLPGTQGSGLSFNTYLKNRAREGDIKSKELSEKDLLTLFRRQGVESGSPEARNIEDAYAEFVGKYGKEPLNPALMDAILAKAYINESIPANVYGRDPIVPSEFYRIAKDKQPNWAQKFLNAVGAGNVDYTNFNPFTQFRFGYDPVGLGQYEGYDAEGNKVRFERNIPDNVLRHLTNANKYNSYDDYIRSLLQ